MNAERQDLERRARAVMEIQRRLDAVPLIDRIAWLPGQTAFYECRSKRKLFRAGQQSSGKTWSGARELIRRMEGVSPFRPAPVKGWVVCGGGEQAQTVQEKVWELVPRHLLADGCAFDSRKGAFLGKYPKLIFKNGSIAEFKSGQSDVLNLASGTLDFIWVDEPPESERVYHELLKRLLKRNGDMFLTMTPVNRDIEWIRRECEADHIMDIHYELTAENMIPVGHTEPLKLIDGTPCDQAWIDQIIAETPPAEVPVTIHGGWEFRSGCAYFDKAWNPEAMVVDRASGKLEDRLPKEFALHLGVDYGTQPGKQIAVLLAVWTSKDGTAPSAYVLDEYVDVVGTATPAMDARGILAMLQRNGQKWGDLHCAYGDRVHMPGTDQEKSNQDLALAIVREMQRGGLATYALNPQLQNAKKGTAHGKGAPDVGGKWLRVAMLEGRFSVHPRCARVIKALPKYSGADDEHKDPVDAIRYSLDLVIFAGIPRGPVRQARRWG